MKHFSFLFFFLLFVSSSTFAQREKGKTMKTPSISSKTKTETEAKKQNFNDEKKDIEFSFEEEPRLQFSNSFETSKTEKKATSQQEQGTTSAEGINIIRLEPIREVNPVYQDDTSSIDEGELQIVEIEEFAQFEGSEELVEIASYFSVWDTQSINPYGISANDFESVIPIKLYDLTQNRYWSAPLDNCPTTSHFGWRWKRWHKGTDLDLETGDPVYSVFDGIVRVAGVHSGYGKCIVVRHYNGLETLYGHLSRINLEANTIVKAGDMIGLGGNSGRSSGSHLHFETRYEGNQFDPENIYKFAREHDKTEILSQEFLLTPQLYDYLRGGKSKIVTTAVEDEIPSITTTLPEAEFEEEALEEEEVPVNIVRKVWVTVKKGDTLSSVAKRNNSTIDEICQLNKIRSSQTLKVGMRLRIK
jgi:murein DD-endopeptidase MepM/ murein hydrolase activator NlpD